MKFENGNLPFLGSIVNALDSDSSVRISNYTSVEEGFTKVKVLVSVCWTAQYSKSRPEYGIDSITLDKFYEVIFVCFYLKLIIYFMPDEHPIIIY
jgi:hypothetical protein